MHLRQSTVEDRSAGPVYYRCEKPLEAFFEPYRRGVIGYAQPFRSPYGVQRMVYADWTASGRLYAPIERKMLEVFGPYVANTHTESNRTGSLMTTAYRYALRMIKAHAGADSYDAVFLSGTGMTGAVNKLQRMLGLRIPEEYRGRLSLTVAERPVIFITHMEHHSNQISWQETIGEVICVPPDEKGRVSVDNLKKLLYRYKDRPFKIGAFTACSNVTGVVTPYYELARVMHSQGGVCFVDFSASAPYVDMTMHPADPMEKLDAVMFSPHKFLGGPGTSGVLIADSRLFQREVPDHPGGGTVQWTDPWGGKKYWEDLETREDGGTPGFLQAIRIALCMQLKTNMGTGRMAAREKELLSRLWSGLKGIPQVNLLEEERPDRLGIVSFTIRGVHYNLAVRLLSDRYGIQARGGCSCAGTYGHYLFGIDKKTSAEIVSQLEQGDGSSKPGWIRMSLHPVMTNAEADWMVRAVREIALYGMEWGKDYRYDPVQNEFRHRTYPEVIACEQMFDL